MFKVLSRATKGNVIREAWDKLAKLPKANCVCSLSIGMIFFFYY